MVKKEERGEDLNPRSKDVDEKIRRLLDPSVPDEPVVPKKSTTPPKIKQVDVKEPIAETLPDTPEATAPEVVLTTSKSRKVIVPVEHAVDETVPEKLPEAEEPVEKPVVKIAISHDEESKEELAEKLDAAIADLNEEPEEPTAPVLDGATVPEEPESEPEPEKEEKSAPKTDEEDEKPLPKPAVVEDEATDKAVKDIVASEGDELLEVEDAIRESTAPEEPPKKRFSLKGLLLNKRALKLYIVLLLLGTIGAALYPTSRYVLMNLAGVRSSSTVSVVDSSTQQPLKNVAVTIGSVTAKTDSNGVAKLEKLKLGKTVLKLERIAFATSEKTITVGWGSNPLGSQALTPTGAQYKFEVTDVLSAKAIAGAEAETANATARSDEKGVITLTLPETDEAEVTVTIKAATYRTETLKLNVATKEVTKLKLAAERKHVFVSKRSGKFDIYSVYADGKDEKLVLAGSGNEKDDLTLLPHPAKDTVAYVSTRAGKKNKDGYVLNDLILLNVVDGKTTPITSIERVQLVGWVGDRLVYVAIAGGDSAANPKRNRLMSYNLEDNKSTELATSNYFNDLLIARGVVYFAPSSAYAGGTAAQFFQQKADGSEQKSLFGQEVWSIVRTSYDHFALSVGQQWYDYALGSATPKKLDVAPTSKTSRVYIDSPDGKKSAWVDQRDGKGTLIIYDIASGKETTLSAKAGLGLPLVWLDNHTLVFRVDSKDEVADYAISLDGGETLKIKDVTKTGGLDSWYYY